MKMVPALFEQFEIRRAYDAATDTWLFSVVDIIGVLTEQADFQTARKYWNKLKERLTKEGSQSVTNCHRLKLPAADGKSYLTDVASAETLLRLVQSRETGRHFSHSEAKSRFSRFVNLQPHSPSPFTTS